MFKIQRTGHNSFRLQRDGRTIGSAKSQKEARDIARKLWYDRDMQMSKTNEGSHRG